MDEFDIIAKYFRPLTQGHDDLKNDAAVLHIPDGFDLVVTSDVSSAGTHFLKDTSPADIAHKALRRNLSDLAAMGAKPLCYQLNIVFPEKPTEKWLADFTSALLADQKEFGIYCSGGDTSSSNVLSIAITAIGLVPSGKALTRSGAKPGDYILLTGPVGDALIGLRVLKKKIKTKDDDHFIKAYRKPIPRTAIVDLIRPHAKAAIDISDGLIADLGHICEASACAAEIAIAPGIFSKIDVPGIKPADRLTGGDDYELLLAVSPDQSDGLLQKLTQQGLKPLKIGEFKAGSGVMVFDEKGQKLAIKSAGWQHF